MEGKTVRTKALILILFLAGAGAVKASDEIVIRRGVSNEEVANDLHKRMIIHLCEINASVGERNMRDRQSGMELAEAIAAHNARKLKPKETDSAATIKDILTANKEGEANILLAYKVPKYLTEDEKIRAIHDFAEQTKADCLLREL